MTRKERAVWLILAAFTAWLDLWTKGLFEYPAALNGAPLLQDTVLENWLYYRTIWNVGGVWSTPIPGWVLKAATTAAVPLIAGWLFWDKRADKVESIGKLLVLGGAVGNLYDRWKYDAVRDFIEVWFGSLERWHWPTFNIADVALVVGIGLLLIRSFRKEESEGAAAEGGAAA